MSSSSVLYHPLVAANNQPIDHLKPLYLNIIEWLFTVNGRWKRWKIISPTLVFLNRPPSPQKKFVYFLFCSKLKSMQHTNTNTLYFRSHRVYYLSNQYIAGKLYTNSTQRQFLVWSHDRIHIS